MAKLSMSALRLRCVALHAEGRSDMAIASTMGLSLHSVKSFLAEAKEAGRQKQNAAREKQAAKIAIKSKLAAIEVPTWVSEAKLEKTYREIAVAQDDFAAASHCRAMKREMQAGA